MYKAYKRGCPTALDSIAIKSTEDTNAVVQPWWKVQHTTTVLQKLRWKMAQSSKITKTGTYQCGCRVNRAGMCHFFFFFKWQQLFAVAQYQNSIAVAQQKFICCYQNQNPISPIQYILNSKFKIQYLQYQHILNSKFKFP